MRSHVFNLINSFSEFNIEHIQKPLNQNVTYLIWNPRITALYTLRIMEKQHFIRYFYLHIASTISKYINQIFMKNIHYKYSPQIFNTNIDQKYRIFHKNICT